MEGCLSRALELSTALFEKILNDIYDGDVPGLYRVRREMCIVLEVLRVGSSVGGYYGYVKVV